MLVDVRDLKLSISGRPILNGVNLGMEEGEIYGLLGPNGAGKSVTMSVLAGLRKPASGKVVVLDLDPAQQAVRLRHAIGVLPEQAGFYEWMNAEDYLRWFAGLYGRSLAVDLAQRHLRQVGLDAANRQSIGSYSRGMRQRLSLARALVNDPKLLILDEPTNGLDPRGRLEIHNVLLELVRRSGTGIMMCTHLLDDVDRLCSRIGIIHHGKTVVEGYLAELLATHAVASRFRLRLASVETSARLPSDIRIVAEEGQWKHVQITAERPASEVWADLLAHGWDILEIHAEGEGLEELYLSVTQEKAAA